jgi:hypothetical protein
LREKYNAFTSASLPVVFIRVEIGNVTGESRIFTKGGRARAAGKNRPRQSRDSIAEVAGASRLVLVGEGFRNRGRVKQWVWHFIHERHYE